MRRTLGSLLLLTMVLGVAILQAETKAAQGATVGRWKLDVKKSDFGTMPAPKSLTVVVSEDTPTSLKWRAMGVDAKGKKISESFAGAVDGKEYPIKGSENGESVAYTRESDNVIKGTAKSKDGATMQETITLSDDKNTITVKGTATGPKGEMNWTEVYERIPSGMTRPSAAAPKNKLKK